MAVDFRELTLELMRGLNTRVADEGERYKGFTDRLEMLEVTVRAGEEVIAVEDLDANIREYEVALTPTESKTLRTVADHYGVTLTSQL